MKSKIIVLVCAMLVVATNGQLICYYCDDCTSSSSESVVEPCGRSKVTTPAPTLAPGGDGGGSLPTTSSGLTTQGLTNGDVGNGDGAILTTLWPGMTSSQIVNGGSNTGGGVVMTTIWPVMNGGSNSNNNGGTVLTTAWKRADLEANAVEYACATIKSNDHRVVKRGCARQARSKDETCSGISEENHELCTLCTSPLCNNDN